YKTPMRIYPAVHYIMGGLWVDYNLMTTIPGLFALGECNFSDHGANRLGASALMQGLGDGYFVIPYTIGDYLAKLGLEDRVDTKNKAFQEAEKAVEDMTKKLLSIQGKKTVDQLHRELGEILWNKVGMARTEKGLKEAISDIQALREEFWKNLKLTGTSDEINQSLEKAGRLADFLELAELIAKDALHRDESCGSHFRLEHQTEEGEAKRDDEHFAYVAAWEYQGEGKEPKLHKEELNFEFVQLTQRSYK
ncbi:MAG: FAD-binding protein, partial [Planctomycetota bacterium]